jgi:hypothetical protein
MNATARPVAALLTAVAAVALWYPAGGGPVAVAAAAGDCPAAAHHAEVVFEHANGASLAVCVGFAAPTISGVDLIRQTGIEVDMQQYGGAGEAVCQLDNEPQPVPGNCFGTSHYWALFVSSRCAGWQYAASGISSQDFSDGDLEGFHFVPQSGTRGPPPGPGGSCPPIAASTPAPTPVPPTSPPATAASVHATSAPAPSSSRPATPTASPSTAAQPTAASSAAASTAAAVAAIPTRSDTPSTQPPIAAGPLRRTGEAPAPAPSGAPLWAWALGGLVVAGLAISLGVRTMRRRR